MKKTLLLSGIVALSIAASAQDIIFKETFGTPSSQKGENIVNHVWDNLAATGITYSWTCVDPVSPDIVGTINVRSNNPSDSLAINGIATASGHGNLYFNANTINTFSIKGINTLNYDNVNLSFVIYGKNKADITLLKLQYDNGSGLTDLGATQIGALLITKGKWQNVSNLTLPAGLNLSLTFSTPTTNSQNLVLGVAQPLEIRIDDVKITGTLKVGNGTQQVNSDNRKLTVYNSTISFSGFQNGNVEIYNIQGKKVFTSELKETIQPQLTKGFYIVRVGDFRQKISL